MARWEDVPLGDVITLQRGFDLPSQDRQPGFVPIISSSGVTGTHAVARVPGPGVVTGRYGTIGQVFYITEDFWPLNTTLWVKDFKGNDPRFVSYLLQTVNFESHNDKSSVPGVNRNHLHLTRVLKPPVPEQRAIAHILGTLDDKIELNRLMNDTLEAMTRALFQSWFVDFDPVRAKVEGRAPAGMDAATAAQFPDGFVDSELGKIPRGWCVGDVYEIADVIYGAPFASRFFNADKRGLPLIRIRDLATHDPEIYTTEVHPRQTVIESGNIVVGMDGEFRVHHWKGPRSLLNQRVCAFSPRSVNARVFVAETLRAPLAFFERSKTGTTVIHLGKSDIDTFRVIVPPQPVLRAFGEATEPLLDRTLANAAETHTLAVLRDTLLPELLTGVINIRVAEEVSKEAGVQ